MSSHESSIELLSASGRPGVDTVIENDDEDFTRLLERLQEIIKQKPDFSQGWLMSGDKAKREIAMAFHKMVDEKLQDAPDRRYMPGDEYVMKLTFKWT